MSVSEEQVGFALNVHINGHLVEQPEEGGQQRCKLLPVDGFVPIHVQQVKKILDVVAGGLLTANHVENPWKLVLSESMVFVFVELIKQFLKQRGDVLRLESPPHLVDSRMLHTAEGFHESPNYYNHTLTGFQLSSAPSPARLDLSIPSRLLSGSPCCFPFSLKLSPIILSAVACSEKRLTTMFR
jgi:hypothetical protein